MDKMLILIIAIQVFGTAWIVHNSYVRGYRDGRRDQEYNSDYWIAKDIRRETHQRK